MKWARFRGLDSSLPTFWEAGACVGKKRVMRENREGCWGGGRFRIDFPGVAMVIAEDEGEQEELDDDDAAAIDDVGLLISHHMHHT